MDRNNNSIITEDGQRLTINHGLITGTEDPGPGLAYETGNIQDENPSDNEEVKSTSYTPANKNTGDDSKT